MGISHNYYTSNSEHFLFEDKGYTFIDMFSCKPFDVEKAEKFIIELFRPEKVEKNLIASGKHFPRVSNEITFDDSYI